MKIFRRTILFGLCVTISSTCLQGQIYPVRTWTPENYYRDLLERRIIDSSLVSVYYDFRFVHDTLDKKPLYDIYILDVGNLYSSFQSMLADKRDTLVHKAAIASKPFNPNAWLKENQYTSCESYYFDYPKKGTLTVSTLFMGGKPIQYIYEEPIPPVKWQFEDQEIEIMGYQCQKATTNFRGRQYEVWFTIEIPIRNGPWKFNGLPGLILKAESTDGLFGFTAFSITRSEKRALWICDLDKDIVKANRKEIMKLKNLRWSDPIFLWQINGAPKIHILIGNSTRTGEPGDLVYHYIPTLELE